MELSSPSVILCTILLFNGFSVHFLPTAVPPSFLCCVAPCSSVQLPSSVEGDGEYLLLEECESKPPPHQTSL